VHLDAGACVDTHFIFSAAYIESFNPSDLCTNYLADIGASPNSRGEYSFSVPAGATFVVIVHEIVSGAGCPAYGLTVGTCTCVISFSDVQPADYFYPPVQYLYCHGAISGYGDNTFRPNNTTTRGQLAKIVSLSFDLPTYTPPTPSFSDVPTTHPFYQYVETAYHAGLISGYSCGVGCLQFRPGNNITRGQLCKIIVLARGWTTYTPPTPTFRDVAATDPFYQYIETAYNHGIISGYNCGTACLEFRPGSSATRGQICKIVYNAVTLP